MKEIARFIKKTYICNLHMILSNSFFFFTNIQQSASQKHTPFDDHNLFCISEGLMNPIYVMNMNMDFSTPKKKEIKNANIQQIIEGLSVW